MEKLTNVDKYLASNLIINIANSLDFSGVYDARIEEIRKDSVYISMPSDRGQPMPIRPGMKVEISFISTGGRCTFKSTVKGRIVQRIQMIELEKPAYLVKSELREFFRIEVMQKITLYALTRDIKTGNMVRSDSFQAVCADISGGGSRLISPRPVGNISEFEVDFSSFIPDLTSVFSRVVRDGGSKDGKFDIGIEFTSLRDSDRDRIVKYVFKRQIELRMLRNK